MKSVLHADVRKLMSELRARREELGYQRPTLAGQLQISPQQLGEWERGEVMPQLGSVCRWAEALDYELVLSYRRRTVAGWPWTDD